MKKTISVALILACLNMAGGVLAQTEKPAIATKPKTEKTQGKKPTKERSASRAEAEKETSAGQEAVSTMVEGLKIAEGKWTGPVSSNKKPNGFGMLCYSKDDANQRIYYFGMMVEGVREGEGILVYSTGAIFDGVFEKDALKEGVFKDPVQQSYYKGTYKDNQPWKGKWFQMTGGKHFAEVSQGKVLVTIEEP